MSGPCVARADLTTLVRSRACAGAGRAGELRPCRPLKARLDWCIFGIAGAPLYHFSALYFFCFPTTPFFAQTICPPPLFSIFLLSPRLRARPQRKSPLLLLLLLLQRTRFRPTRRLLWHPRRSPTPLASCVQNPIPMQIARSLLSVVKPYQVDTDTNLIRGVQTGYNLCNSTTETQESLCQTSFFTSLDGNDQFTFTSRALLTTISLARRFLPLGSPGG